MPQYHLLELPSWNDTRGSACVSSLRAAQILGMPFTITRFKRNVSGTGDYFDWEIHAPGVSHPTIVNTYSGDSWRDNMPMVSLSKSDVRLTFELFAKGNKAARLVSPETTVNQIERFWEALASDGDNKDSHSIQFHPDGGEWLNEVEDAAEQGDDVKEPRGHLGVYWNDQEWSGLRGFDWLTIEGWVSIPEDAPPGKDSSDMTKVELTIKPKLIVKPVPASSGPSSSLGQASGASAPMRLYAC